jgi:23S rRNA (adenine2503-C2)-methyltransferase
VKPALAGLSVSELAEVLKPLPAFRARQLFRHLSQGVRSFSAMTDFSLSLRDALGKRFALYSSEVSQRFVDEDGTVKIQLTLKDGERIEAVLLSDEENRRTACLSTQAGCPMGCVFCKTGSLGFKRNLDSAEIIEQFLHLRSIEDISNIVIMGMGEPLLNLGELRKALAFITAGNFSKRRITISTSGIAAGICDLADNGPDVRLAVSLTAADPILREKLMPVTRANPLPLLKESLAYYRQKRGRRITLEAVLLGGLNTGAKDVDAIAVFARGLDAVINLIPWNPVAGMSLDGQALREPSKAEVSAFMQALQQKGLNVTRRLKKGRNVSGACGQLG